MIWNFELGRTSTKGLVHITSIIVQFYRGRLKTQNSKIRAGSYFALGRFWKRGRYSVENRGVNWGLGLKMLITSRRHLFRLNHYSNLIRTLTSNSHGCVARFILRPAKSTASFRYAAIWKRFSTNFAWPIASLLSNLLT
jgi:hypothetical protein